MNYGLLLKETLCVLTLFLSKNVDSLVDQCSGRCNNKQFCNENTQACEPCGVFCDLKSSFSDPDDCQSHCPYVIYGTNETRDCPITCPPGYYCEKFLQTCESCQVLCNPDKQIYTQKCPKSCSSVVPDKPSQEIGLTKSDGKPTDAENKGKKKVKNRDIIIIFVCVGVPFAVGIIYLTVRLYKKWRSPKYPVEATTGQRAESEVQKMVISGGASV